MEYGAKRIGAVTTSGAFKEFPIPSHNTPNDIAASPTRGVLWFTENSANRLAKITVAGAVTESPSVMMRHDGIVAGPDGRTWFAETSGNDIAALG